MPTVSIHAPKTPVTKGSNGIAAATVPNVCKMPGPPAPFVPTPLPNIGRSSMMPQGYSTSVKIEGNPVAIQGASFGSMGDVASKASGGGIVSSNAEGPTKFIGPGSLTVKIEGKNVQLLGDIMSNNNGPAGSPPNAATMGGVLQGPLVKAKAAEAGITEEAEEMCNAYCECKAAGTPYQTCVHAKMYALDAMSNWQRPLKTEIPFDMSKTPPAAFESTEPPRPTSWWLRPASRRPDAIVLNDVNEPWQGSNIKAVIECKWGDDDYGPGQRAAYVRIAGDEKKLIEMDDKPGSDNECRCTDDNQEKPVPVPVPVTAPEDEKDRGYELPDLRPAGAVAAAVGIVALGVLAVAAGVAAAPVLATAAAGVAVIGLLGMSSNSSSEPAGA